MTPTYKLNITITAMRWTDHSFHEKVLTHKVCNTLYLSRVVLQQIQYSKRGVKEVARTTMYTHIIVYIQYIAITQRLNDLIMNIALHYTTYRSVFDFIPIIITILLFVLITYLPAHNIQVGRPACVA